MFNKCCFISDGWQKMRKRVNVFFSCTLAAPSDKKISIPSVNKKISDQVMFIKYDTTVSQLPVRVWYVRSPLKSYGLLQGTVGSGM